MAYEMIPWGNAYYNTSKCGSGDFDKDKMYCWIEECGKDGSIPEDCFSGKEICQHGETECTADLIEACVIGHNPPETYTRFVWCFEGDHQSDARFAGDCAEQAGVDFKTVQECVTGDEGHQLNAANAKKTAAIGTDRKGTPWVLVDGKVLDDPDTLLSAVCSAYTGSKPAGCASVVSHVSHPIRVSC